MSVLHLSILIIIAGPFVGFPILANISPSLSRESKLYQAWTLHPSTLDEMWSGRIGMSRNSLPCILYCFIGGSFKSFEMIQFAGG